MNKNREIGTIHIGETTGRTLQNLHESNLLREWCNEPPAQTSVPADIAAVRAEIAATGEADKLVISDK